MSRQLNYIIVIIMLAGILQPGVIVAQDTRRWVSDQFEITMRTGKSSRQSIVRMLKSGTRVELLEVDNDAGYSLVRTGSGAEGWVLNRYLLKSPPARVRLPDLESRLQKTEQDRDKLRQQVRSLQQERQELQNQVERLDGSSQDLQQQLNEIRQLSAGAIQIADQNKRLKQQSIETERMLEELKAENARLGSRSDQRWFLAGAGSVIVGMIIGLIIPRIRWRRKSKWGDL